MAGEIEIRQVSASDADFIGLVRMLDIFLAGVNGEEHGFYSQFNKPESLTIALVAYFDGKPVGCGGFRQLDEGTVEIKRMYVEPGRRKTGVGQAILSVLEAEAAKIGHTVARLETSKRMEPAVRLYTKAGYSVIPNYGPYIGVEDSVCMEKRL